MSVSTLKNAFGRTRLMAVLCSLLFVFAVACGDDGDSGNNGANNGGNNGADVGTDDTGSEDVGDEDADDQDQDAVDEDTSGECQPVNIPNAQCDPKCQTGCGDTETCIAGSDTNGNLIAACEPDGTNTEGQACGPEDGGCVSGLGCLGTEGDAICREICVPSGDPCANAEASCVPLEQGLDVGICIVAEQECEVYPPEDTCEDPGENCYQTGGGGTTCAPFNPDANEGDSCAGANECNDQQACAGPQGGPSTCVVKCDPNAEEAENGCDDGQTCQPFSNDPDSGQCVTPPE